MATQSKSKPTPAETVKDEVDVKPRRNKKLIILLSVILIVSLLITGGVFMVIKKRQAADAVEEENTPTHATAKHEKNTTPPVYIPIDTFVTNLADEGGSHVIQVGLMFEITDAKAGDQVKQYLPTIRSSILLLLSRKTATELLTKEGKDKLANDILIETTIPFGGERDQEAEPLPKAKPGKKKIEPEYPVKKVLFSTFIIQ